MGAWIEIYRCRIRSMGHCVAPFMGAWIEIFLGGKACTPIRSHPSWVRGLKYNTGNASRGAGASHPSWVRGLKLKLWELVYQQLMSHPSWVRGLKCSSDGQMGYINSRTLYGCVD